ncbi:GNAT family N-acetyltransferase [Leisingera aquaemixtae]|uniref:GNAT family N-acetyltransferase n=1 Tax=Leisingera aquaemixtae TaxID=1396826 RepID=UPI001C961444|nr:GNAT family protein [Leisingera aquaemixtae]MBY6068783.1 GNAT family N-acetyltransferase [Leisingera aquaemixtae]
MTERINDHGQPIGAPLPDWQGARLPGHSGMAGRYCRVEPLDAARHTADLFAAFSQDQSGAIWTYIPWGPFGTEAELRTWVQGASGVDAQPYFAIVNGASGKAEGVASYMRIKPEHGVIEVGGITYAPSLQRTPAATEAMFLMMARVFNDLGYRRYEWKCDALNAPSCRAAERLGFTYEGLFRQAIVYKGRNRDTAWYSVIDSEWPRLEAAYAEWLDPGNFDAQGQQMQSLGRLIAAHRG